MRRSRKWIEDELRTRIRRGDYPPGSRMPTHRILQAELGASSATLQKAFDRLVEQGFVTAHGAMGTFVASALPNVSCIALVLPEVVGVGAWNRFWATGKRVAEEWDGDAHTVRCYHIAGSSIESEGHQQLLRDAADGGIAGMIFLTSPFYLKGSPLLTMDIPRVVMPGRQPDITTYRASVISMVQGPVLSDLVQRCATAGRRRLAAITARNQGVWMEQCLPLLRAHSIATRPEWWLGMPVSTESADCSRGVAHLLFSLPERQRPDALLITDDNLVPYVTAGLLDAHPTGAIDVTVLAHANFPGVTRAAVPCDRFGPDMSAMMRSAIAEIDRLTGGAEPRLSDVAWVVREH